MMKFDYDAPAELYMPKGRGRGATDYHHFTTAAEAIRFAIEDLPALRLLNTWMQIDNERYRGAEIRKVYESDEYPLPRRSQPSASRPGPV